MVTIVVFHFGSQHFRARDELRQSMSNYDVLKAELGNPADREILLNIVDELFSDTVDSSGIISFNKALKNVVHCSYVAQAHSGWMRAISTQYLVRW